MPEMAIYGIIEPIYIFRNGLFKKILIFMATEVLTNP